MGKFDGMDPKLVRDLLAEVKRATEQMRSVEGRVTQVMSRAGLATKTTHRPVQVADAADVMVRDVNRRLELLEKRADEPRVRDQGKDATPAVSDGAKDDKPKTDDPKKDEPKKDHLPKGDEPKEERGDRRSHYENPRADEPRTGEDKPDAKTGDDKPDAKTREDKPDAKTGDDKPDAKTEDKPDAKTDDKPDAKTEDKPDAKTDDKPDAKTDDKPDAKQCDDSRSDGTKIGDDRSDAEVNLPDTGTDTGTDTDTGKDTGTDTGTNVGDDPKDDDLGSRRDHGATPDSGVSDTPVNNQPADTDPTKPRVIDVNGVKVIQVPIEPPTAEALRDMLRDLDKVQPIDMPTPDTGATNGATTNGADVNAWANDGSDVVSADAKPLNPDALPTIVDNARDIQPHDMPGVNVPAGEYGKGDWAPQHISPDGRQGTIDPGAVAASNGDTPASNGDTPAAYGDTPITRDTPVVNGDTPVTRDTPATGDASGIADTSLAGTGDDGDCKATDRGTPSTGDKTVPPQQQLPDTGTPSTGDRAEATPGNPPPQQVGDSTTRAGASTPTVGQPFAVPPTEPGGQQPPSTGQQVPDTGQQVPDTGQRNPDTGQQVPDTGQRNPDTGQQVPDTGKQVPDTGQKVPGTGTPSTGDLPPSSVPGSTSPGADSIVYLAGQGDVSAWAADGSDVVSVDARPLHPDALRTLVDSARDVQPLDMPSVEVPPGEYGKGEWTPRDIRPDGPPGTIEPGTQDRSV
ncbi:hypothetical protein [Nonomuraea rhizosphaerae]|uniref:hypothetical protein n=1 Tax=Nonomuraea rhizosphaerae TaxID=2665663 RepID=UPI001C5FE060|nr:hypothetical protein [Nonomuraea rhizosphaerae]